MLVLNLFDFFPKLTEIFNMIKLKYKDYKAKTKE